MTLFLWTYLMLAPSGIALIVYCECNGCGDTWSDLWAQMRKDLRRTPPIPVAKVIPQ